MSEAPRPLAPLPHLREIRLFAIGFLTALLVVAAWETVNGQDGWTPALLAVPLAIAFIAIESRQP